MPGQCCSAFRASSSEPAQGSGAKSMSVLRPSLELEDVGDKQSSPVDAQLAADAQQNLAVQAGSDGVVRTAKIVTCPACRLNKLPSVKKFVYTHADHFKPALQIDFVMGKNPVLHLYEDEKEVSNIDLADYDWKSIIQKLDSFGIKPTSQTDEIREALNQKLLNNT